MPHKLSLIDIERIAKTIAAGKKPRKKRKDFSDSEWNVHSLHVISEKNKRAHLIRKEKKADEDKKLYLVHPELKPPKKVKIYTCLFCGKKIRGKTNKEQKFCSRSCSSSFLHQKKNEERLKEKRLWKYKVIVIQNYKATEEVFLFKTKEEGLLKFEELNDKSNGVTIPCLYKDKNQYITYTQNKNEILFLEQVEKDNPPTSFPDEMGKLIEHVVVSKDKDSENWRIINKQEYKIEQMFSIDGNEEKFDGKYILDNFLVNDNITKEVMIIDSKMIIKYSLNNIKIISAEHQKIILQLYSYIEDYIIKNDIDYIIMFGIVKENEILLEMYRK
jgi:hypothetical protein